MRALFEDVVVYCYEDEPIQLSFYLRRQIPPRARKADATNLQKALEDALQGILFKNDSQVVEVHTHVLEQSKTAEPFVYIECGLHHVDFDSVDAEIDWLIRMKGAVGLGGVDLPAILVGERKDDF